MKVGMNCHMWPERGREVQCQCPEKLFNARHRDIQYRWEN